MKLADDVPFYFKGVIISASPVFGDCPKPGSITKGTLYLRPLEQTGNSHRFADKEAALSELAGSGWTITGPYQRTDGDSKQGLYGFALTRTAR
jgi:hypothetical protein